MAKNPKDFTPLDAMRHSTAHLLAAAVAELHPDAQFGVGPVVENGFYYDMKTSRPLTTDDFVAIEEKMGTLQKSALPFVRREMPIDEAIEFFRARGQQYKVELLSDLKSRGTTNLKDEELQDFDPDSATASVYETGDFVDLCRGPHVATTADIGAFKLTKLAGAYWRGKAENDQLTRVYGVAFATPGELDEFLKQQEEAEKRDHRKLGRELGLFVFSDLVGPGLPLWTPKGTVMRELLNDFVWSLRRAHDYERVTIPHIAKKDLYETSGHWAKYADDLFKIHTREDHLFAMKPMNCPHHAQIFASEPRSYRDLPVRFAETTMVYRDEQSGELSGLSRVLSITQDDAHVFCRVSQVRAEAEIVWNIISDFYRTFGFALTPRLSRRDPAAAEKYLGAPEDWDRAEAALQEILVAKGVEWIDGIGEAAFYGPKIDFMAKDSIGRIWQVATIQLDFNQPRNFGLTCVNEQGEKEQIVMIHCAIMGSIERFMSVLIEHYAGVFPLWLAPVQLKLLPVSDKHVDAAMVVARELKAVGLRVSVDADAATIGAKVRRAETEKIPLSVVFGDKEVGGEPWQIRVRGSKEMKIMSVEECIAWLVLVSKERSA
ncbi:MAG: threonine--tRNA ligase [Candidatus Magasanikbacteria bacterium RIFCSPHIGHO2_02_FULL_50_9b]|uniref:Threonine--tRNA ligase n=2 Tax=Candidatus Magasanikiibacteriota TaxID=1752731 RepID=A0A1F6M7Z5_9BACT|nr:MAG: threonine--tRNA ligase [Candidatus Magasanikbacteria bacterium RIFCSPHIGHO2_02_FULL_50_9b]